MSEHEKETLRAKEIETLRAELEYWKGFVPQHVQEAFPFFTFKKFASGYQHHRRDCDCSLCR